ncbi:PIN-like domain-containing protein [Aureivirga sp. CE67]|uniref:PIN-like domain-containing protein n=1 Tax=Aureivirga sp. CE67 TaxID=1788983 RepID=UPI0018C9E265|nr:PIN domain-containing protein [Aureivirga sp. CE67]
MKNTFQEYQPIDGELLKQIWHNSIIVFDTNVLLNLYRYSTNTSDNFLQIISELNERVWLPYQVGLEFNRNRIAVISDQKKSYSDFEKKIHELINEIENRNRNPFFSESLTTKIVEIKIDLNLEIKKKKETYDFNLKTDSILDKVNIAFKDKVGQPFIPDELLKLQKEGEKRYKTKIPPGYCDIKKPENERYGDLILWKEIIGKAKESNINVLFVLDDRKEDWWFEHQGKTIAPRPELIKEFHTATGKNIHFYKPFQFLEYSNQYLKKKIANDVIEEVKNYRPSILKKEDIKQIYLTLKGDSDNFNILTSEMKNKGYSIDTESSTDNKLHFINVLLPNIPDLERRFNSKFISNISNYNMILLESNKDK